MAKIQYKTVDTSTLEGLKQAERLKANGWIIDRVGLHLIYFHRQLSITGRVVKNELPPPQNIPAPRTQLGNEIREALRAHKHDAEFFKHAPRAPLDPQYAYCCQCQNYLLVPCPDCGGDCETLLAALKTSLQWFEASEHFKISAAERAAARLQASAKVHTRVVEKAGKFVVEYKDRLLVQGEIGELAGGAR